MFSIIIHKKALKEINGFPAEDRERIFTAIRDMATEPFAGDVKPIKGVKGVLRRRIGEYRAAVTVNFEKGRTGLHRRQVHRPEAKGTYKYKYSPGRPRDELKLSPKSSSFFLVLS